MTDLTNGTDDQGWFEFDHVRFWPSERALLINLTKAELRKIY